MLGGLEDEQDHERVVAQHRSGEEASGITVIRLKHAKAEGLAATLSRVVPAG